MAEKPVLEEGLRWHDIAIVGGGPVGMLLALLLARDGRDVVVVEGRSEISPRPRAMGIHPPAVAVLTAAGVDLGQGSVRIRRGEARADGRALGRMEFADPIVSLPQQEVERMLRDAFLALRPGALLLGEKVTGLIPSPKGMALEGTRIVASLVVGADGVDSTVRRACGIPFERRPGVSHYLMADLPVGVDSGIEGSESVDGTEVVDSSELVDGSKLIGRSGLAVLSFERAGVVESFPLPGARRRWVAVMSSPVAPEVERLAEVVAARTGQTIPVTGAASSFTARQRLAASMIADRIVLIGDAAHELSPIGGQGLNLGWLDAQALATLLREEQSRADAHPSPDAWLRFDRSRRRSARRAQTLAAFNMLVGRRLPLPLHRLRSLAIRILARPPLRGVFTDAFTMRRR